MTFHHDHRCSHRTRNVRSRRATLIALACAVVLPMDRLVAATDAPADDERFMRAALDEARQGDFPFGAVIVRDEQILVRAHNLGRTNDDPTAHGEMMAIRRGLIEHGSLALRGSTLYTTGEPCAMCMGAILWCRFGRLVFAASVQQLATTIDQIAITSRPGERQHQPGEFGHGTFGRSDPEQGEAQSRYGSRTRYGGKAVTRDGYGDAESDLSVTRRVIREIEAGTRH
jgi:tRNA(adenine34) deaminase